MTARDAEPDGAARRPGPVPLVLHMAMARAQYAGAQAALLDVEGAAASLPQHSRAALAAWGADYKDVPREAVSAALAQHCQGRLEAFLTGLERYQTHPFRRPEGQAHTVLRIGDCRLMDHGGAGVPVLLIPSLINPGWVLDLLPDVSFARYLVERGFHVFSIDWGVPGALERRFSIGDYITQRLVPAMDTIAAAHGAMHIAGYCLGGNLALAATLKRQALVRSFCAIAAPWDFAAVGRSARAIAASTYAQLAPILAKTGEMPPDALQALFAQLDPTQIERKFVGFAVLPQEPRSQVERFIALEDWSNSGPPLGAGAVDDCFGGFYRDNKAMRGDWVVDGACVNPAALDRPALVLAARRDKIVPQASTLALAKQLPRADVLKPDAGHVGMMVGSRAEQLCWQPVADWFDTI